MQESNLEAPKTRKGEAPLQPDQASAQERRKENQLEQVITENPAENLNVTPSSAPVSLDPADTASTTKAQSLAKIDKMDTENKIKTLSMMAFSEGIEKSVEMARALKDPFILDALHDKLVGELYNELIEKGKLREV